MKCSALKVDFNGVGFDPLGSRSPPYERIKFGYTLENVCFLLLSSNLARERLQIDTGLQRLRFGEFLADNIVRFINLFTYLLTYLQALLTSFP